MTEQVQACIASYMIVVVHIDRIRQLPPSHKEGTIQPAQL